MVWFNQSQTANQRTTRQEHNTNQPKHTQADNNSYESSDTLLRDRDGYQVPGIFYLCFIWFGLASLGFASLGQLWFGLVSVRFGLVDQFFVLGWLGLVRFGLVFCSVQSGLVWLGVVGIDLISGGLVCFGFLGFDLFVLLSLEFILFDLM